MKIEKHLLSIGSYSFTFLRVWLGAAMMWYSFPMLFQGGMEDFTSFVSSLGIPLPKLLAPVAKCSEFFGGLMVVTGFYSRIGAALIAIDMFVAFSVAGSFQIFTSDGIAFNLFIICIAIIMGGSGPFSLKNWPKNNFKQLS